MAKIQLNGKKIKIRPKLTVYELLKQFKLNRKKVAIEYNGKIISQINYKKKYLKHNDKVEVVQFIGGGEMKKDIFKVANIKLKSRLIVGTGKYKNLKETTLTVKESGADMVTVAIRRVNIYDKKKPILTDYLDPKKLFIYLILLDVYI